MLSNKLEKNLIILFHEISRGESIIECSRRMLTNNYEYDSYQIFNYLDTESKNRIDSLDLINYLTSKYVEITEIEAQLIILFYDQNYQGVLTYEDFKNLVLNENALSTNSSSNNFLCELSKDIDECFLNLLLNELKLVRNCLKLLNELNKDENFNIHNIYHKLKGNNCINEKSLGAFFIDTFAIFSDNDLKMILRRLDINKDGKIDLNDLHIFLGYPKCSKFCTISPCPSCEIKFCKECLKESKCLFHDEIHNDFSPIKKNLEKINIIKNKDKDIFNNKEKIDLNKNGYNYDYKQKEDEFNKINEKINLTSYLFLENYYKNDSNNNDILNIKDLNFEDEINYENIEEDDFLEYLKQAMIAEKNIEKYKIKLALNLDFNTDNAFCIFESNSKIFLTKEDLKNGLNLLNIYPTSKELNILINKYSNEKDDNLNFLNFFNMIVPYENCYRNIVQNRRPKLNCILSSPMVFPYQTGSDLKNLFNIIIKEENKLNEMKKYLNQNIENNLEKYMNVIDMTKNSYFDIQDLLLFLKKKNIFIDEDSSCLLFIRLDKNHDGKVNLRELENEFNYIN